MTINEAIKNNINKIRKPYWVNKNEYIKLDILENGIYGPWAHFYSSNNNSIGLTNPVNILWLQDNSKDWEEYKE